MADKIKFSIVPETTGMGQIKVGNLEPRDFTQFEEILSKADRFDSTNVRGRLRLTDSNFYNYRHFFAQRKREMEEKRSEHRATGIYEEENTIQMPNFAYAHQIQAVETILKLPSGGLLADQVGMGKTIEAGMLISELAYRDEWRVLVITLSNDDLMNNWHDEMYEKFGLCLAILEPKNSKLLNQNRKLSYRERLQLVYNKLEKYQKTGIVEDCEGSQFEVVNNVKRKYQGVIIPFAYLVDDEFIEMVDEYNDIHDERPFHVDLIVVDESHRYTSTDAASSDNKIKALHKLQIKQTISFNGEERQQKTGRILLLTATPIKNDLNELLQLMQIIDPKYTEDDFREELGLTEYDQFDLTTVLEKPRGVNRWWEWFSRFGERHTRATTIYDETRRKFGVHWKKKNSHSFYFNDNNLYETRPYFTDSYENENGETITVQNVNIKTVDNRIISRTEEENSQLKGNIYSEVIEYQGTVPGLDMDKFNGILKIISYFKHEITLEELLETEFEEKVYGFNNEGLLKMLDKPDFSKFKTFTEKYMDLCNEPDEIEKKVIIENTVVKLLEYMSFTIYGDNSKFFDTFFNFVNNKIPKIQKDKNGIPKVKEFKKLAIILCSDNVFLSLEKMLMLGTIINMNDKERNINHTTEKIIIFCKDDAERRMLVENSHLWDFTNRYRTNAAAAQIGKMSENDVNYTKNQNIVTIAYTTDAEGLNLQKFHTMINYSIVLSPLHMEQRIGRIDRIGQKNEMDVYFLASAQDVEGYILRFFEYELELFSNWSGDTTASTYYDATENGRDVKYEFDKISVLKWKDTLSLSMEFEDKIRTFEYDMAHVFNNVRTRVFKIASYVSDIEEFTKRVIDLTNDDDSFELYL